MTIYHLASWRRGKVHVIDGHAYECREFALAMARGLNRTEHFGARWYVRKARLVRDPAKHEGGIL